MMAAPQEPDITQHAETAYEFGSIHLGHTVSPAETGVAREAAAREAEPVTRVR